MTTDPNSDLTVNLKVLKVERIAMQYVTSGLQSRVDNLDPTNRPHVTPMKKGMKNGFVKNLSHHPSLQQITILFRIVLCNTQLLTVTCNL